MAVTSLGRLRARQSGGMRFGESGNRLGLGLLCVALILVFGVTSQNFLTVSNAFAILLNVSSIAIAAVGSGFLLISGNVDLSIGGEYALVAVVAATLAKVTQNAAIAVAGALVVGSLLGLFNGLLVRYLNISPLIVTIGTAAVFHGLAYVVTGGISVFGFPPGFITLGRTYIGPVPVPVLVSTVVFLAGGLILLKTVAGLRAYAIGGHAAAARLNGIDVERFVTTLYVFNGLLVGLVAVLATARLGSGTPSLGVNFELDVLTAVILGGVAFAGGSGHPLGILVGVVTIGVLNAGMIFVGLQDWYQQIARGSILLIALAFDQYGAHRRRRVSTITSGADVPVSTVPPSVVGEAAAVTSDAATSASSFQPPIFKCAGLSKSFESARAARDVSFSVSAGEIVCLVGDNGAGKSTVIKMISGVIRPDEGELELGGRRLVASSPADARAAGIETVYQDLALCPNLGAAANLVLGKEPTRTRLGVLSLRDDAKSAEIARRRLLELKIVLPDYHQPVGRLSGGQRQSVAIARVAEEGVAMVVLDEPTAALGVAQTRHVMTLIRTLAARGTAFLMITHDIDTVFAVAHRVVVLRLGQVVFDGPARNVTQPQLVHLMAGIVPPELARGTSADQSTVAASSPSAPPVMGRDGR
ncbi:MAG: ABC transporter permease subunit [Chloroflexota bacterium]